MSINISVTSNIELLTKKIDYIKSEVQYLIDKKKTLHVKNDSHIILDIDALKKEKMQELEVLTKELSVLNKQERAQQKKLYELKSISRSLDTLEYRSAQKKGSFQALQLAKEAKDARDKLRDKYTEYLQYEKEYNKYDSTTLPAYLFFYEPVIEKYGICPHIKIDNIITDATMDVETKKNTIQQLRNQWLLQQSDQGKLVFDLKNKIIEKTELEKIKNTIVFLEIQINEFIEKTLSSDLLPIWHKSKVFIEEYANAPIKTKKLKEKFKSFINDISTIFSEYHLPIHTYFSYKYKNIIFHVNEIKQNEKKDVYENFMVNDFTQLIEKYKEQLQTSVQINKFIINTYQNLKNELYLFLTEQKKFITSKTIVITQKGKYFKKWTALTDDEKMERFKSFIEYYIEKYMVSQNILKQEDKQETINKVYTLITEAYKNKSLVFRDFKWNTSAGIIESIKILKYNKEQMQFYLLEKKMNTANDTITSVSSVRKNTPKSCITKENDKLLNESILLFLMTSDKTQNTKDIKNECMEHVKTKLNIKKLNNKDKNIILDRIESVFKVVFK